jgi:hypothetical protein
MWPWRIYDAIRWRFTLWKMGARMCACGCPTVNQDGVCYDCSQPTLRKCRACGTLTHNPQWCDPCWSDRYDCPFIYDDATPSEAEPEDESSLTSCLHCGGEWRGVGSLKAFDDHHCVEDQC